MPSMLLQCRPQMGRRHVRVIVKFQTEHTTRIQNEQVFASSLEYRRNSCSPCVHDASCRLSGQDSPMTLARDGVLVTVDPRQRSCQPVMPIAAPTRAQSESRLI
ncbi:unnamed protein product [Protopolystoma xenopodis]|uniref:Uncharacterized protein n=1 Tax=Protopolystoma xenopodis TaxID=117903 RepID=A0A3S5CBA1_9PLAT|nr:unnamed protein product [Protopolystoma xenopodis]